MKETYKGWTAEQYSYMHSMIRGVLPETVASLNELRSRSCVADGSFPITPWAEAAFNAAREEGMLDPVPFPQPELKAPERGTPYFFACILGRLRKDVWVGSSFDRELLKTGNIYLKEELAEQRVLWNRQEMKHHVVPQWFRDLGDEFLFRLSSGSWVKKKSGDFNYLDMNPEDFKPLPKDVVHVLNGKEYRWPALVTEGTRYCIRCREIICASGGDRGHRDYNDAVTELDYIYALRIADLRAK